MTKRIITFLVCLALCVSCVAVGVINQTAKDSNSADTVNGALTGATLETIAAGDRVGEAGSKLVEGETAGTYVLTDNVTIENVDDPTYKALVNLFNRKDGTALVLDGGNKTITTSIPLFDTIANTTIQNLTVTGPAMTVKSGDLVDFSNGKDRAFGILTAASFGSTKFDNVTVDVDFTIADLTSEGGLCVGAFVGYVDNGVTVINSTNDGIIKVLRGSCSGMSVGGFIGYIKPNTESFLDADNCVNNGDLYVERTAGTGDLFMGGIAAYAYRDQDKADFCLNTGNIYGKTTTGNARIAGILGHVFAPVLTDCINLGDITAEGVDSCTSARASGHLGHQAHGGGGRTQTRCINLGTITLKVPFGGQPAGGIAAWGTTRPNFVECVNLGQVISINTADGSEGFMGGITCFTGVETKVTGCYSVEPTTEQKPGYTKMNADTFSTTTGTASGSKVSFGTSMNKGAYDIISGVISNFAQKGIEIDFEFGAIITLAKYDEVIDGDFTHAIFDAYLAANKTAIDAKATANNNGVATEINALYMTASFPAGDGLEANGDNYIANISLGNAYDTTYIARTYIKIGDVYFYSFSK